MLRYIIVNILYNPLTTLCVQNLEMFCQIIKRTTPRQQCNCCFAR